jgi:DegV family protein with EDD domain
MQIVTDTGADFFPEQISGIKIHKAALLINYQGQVYTGGDDLSYEEFYQRLGESEDMPTTSQPSPADFAEIYRELAKTDPDIFSIHISSGLSGTINSARLGAELVPEANVTIFDSKTLGCSFGWQVEAAAKAFKKGWPVEKVVTYLQKIQEKTETVFTLGSLKYLIHGGRISHLKGLLANLLDLKPIIFVDKVTGRYFDLAKERTLKRAIKKLASKMAKQYGEGSQVRIQMTHGNNPEGLALLKEELTQFFDIVWDNTIPVAPVLGAHTGPSLIGMAIAPANIFELNS